MKITRKQLRRIIKEMHPRAAADDAYVAELEEKEDELATQIRHASKDIHGYKDHYDLAGKSVEELEDILYGLAHSPMQQAMDLSDRDEMEDQMGREQDLSPAELAPKAQGFGRRSRSSKGQRRMEVRKFIKKVIREEKNKILSERVDPAVTANALLDQTMAFLEKKLYNKYPDEEVDNFAVEAMQVMGNIEQLLIKLIEGKYSEKYSEEYY